jgi:hypothetical protein
VLITINEDVVVLIIDKVIIEESLVETERYLDCIDSHIQKRRLHVWRIVILDPYINEVIVGS